MNVLILSDNFPPETNAPASRTFEHAKYWAENGLGVTVLTCAPNFPNGRIHTGYRNKLRQTENAQGIRVVRVKTYITSNTGFIRRIADYISFMISAVVFGIFEKRPDVIVGTSPQFFAALGAWFLGVLKRRPFVFEVRDLWPASIVTVGAMKNGVLIKLLEKLELFLYRRADAIVVVTESFKQDLAYRGVDAKKVYVVKNGVDLSLYSPQQRSEKLAKVLGVDGRFVVAYFGTHGMAHALENVLRAAEILADDPAIIFLFVGNGARKEALQAMAAERGIKNVVFQESVPKEKMPELWSICDVALVHLKDDPVFSTVIPSKVFEAMGMAKPIIIAQPNGEAADIVRQSGAGEWVPPEQPQALALVIRKWSSEPEKVANYSSNARLAAASNSRKLRAAEMAEILRYCADA